MTRVIMDALRDPQVLVTLVATVDAADGALFSASFKAMETSFGFSPTRLGVLQMWQSLSFSISLPVWGVFLPAKGARYLLCLSCLLWAVSTLLTPHVPMFEMQCLLRCVNGAALSGVMPITQAILADAVESSRRGAAFGWMQALHTLSKVLVSYSVLSLGERWAQCYYFVFFLTLLMIVLLWRYLPEDYGKSLAVPGIASSKDHGKSPRLSLSFWSNSLSVVKRIIKIPTFVILVLQGVAGGTPWNAMGFLNVYYSALGFKTEEVARISALTTVGALFGSLFGGYLGDFAARQSRFHGRILTAQASVLLGIPAWYALLTPFDSSTGVVGGGDAVTNSAGHGGEFMVNFVGGSSAYSYAIASGFLFYFAGSWCGTGANRPICADLVVEPGDRAQIVAMWVMIEGVVGSLFGAPLIGFISEINGYDMNAVKQGQNATILASALFRLGLVCWSFCFVAWCAMHVTLPADLRGRKEASEDRKATELQEQQPRLGPPGGLVAQTRQQQQV